MSGVCKFNGNATPHQLKKNAAAVFEAFLKQGVIVRSMISYGFPEYIRVNVGTHEENLI
jgi:histidinol-phosphate aminotransferase